MKYYRKYFDEEKEEKITLRESLEVLTVNYPTLRKWEIKKFLEQGKTLQTPASIYYARIDSR